MKLKFVHLWMLSLLIIFNAFQVQAQKKSSIYWLKAENAFVQQEAGNIFKYTLPSLEKQIILAKEKLIPPGRTEPLLIHSFSLSQDEQQILIFTNTRRVWRLHTRGDYWVYNLKNQTLQQIGKNVPSASLMFARFSPDGQQVAYVSRQNIYVDDLLRKGSKQLTTDGTRKLINGTFDWAYEEEFFCRNGFRWSPDSKKIAFWQIDANQVKDYLMINHTDSIYPKVLPVEYPVAGEAPSPYKIGVITVAAGTTSWLQIPGDPRQHYVPRLEWTANPDELILQQLNRKQNESRLLIGNASNGRTRVIYQEKDAAWIDILPSWDQKYVNGGWDWLNGGREFLWASEKDGWRHLYRVSSDGKKELLVTRGNYDVMEIVKLDEPGGFIYFMASPENATQSYLYRTRLTGKGKPERLSPASQPGTHKYDMSPNGNFALHEFSNYYTRPATEWISLENHQPLNKSNTVAQAITAAVEKKPNLEFFKIKTSEGVEMDAWMVKPKNFDKTKRYPVVFYVYTEPWGQEVKDQFGIGNNHLYKGDMSQDGYLYVSVDNRGTPVPKGRAWRKSIYRQIGLLNIKDQALAAREILKMSFTDSSRVAVWGWSGGGTATLNLLFQYPQLYKTGISIAAVGNQLTYDNIYQERYMGLPQENLEDFVKGSPITHAKNLRGNLLYIHGTGDDNVHYNNAEQLINELVKYNKQFQIMPYPNRTHGISEGEGTTEHLSTLFTNYLKQHCPPGGR